MKACHRPTIKIPFDRKPKHVDERYGRILTFLSPLMTEHGCLSFVLAETLTFPLFPSLIDK